MSWRVANACAERKFGSATRKQIIMFLADKASDDGSGIWCSKGTIQRHTELGHRLINAQPDACGRQFDEGEEIGVVFLVSGGDGPVMLEFGEEPLDPVASPVGYAIQRRRIGSALLRDKLDEIPRQSG